MLHDCDVGYSDLFVILFFIWWAYFPGPCLSLVFSLSFLVQNLDLCSYKLARGLVTRLFSFPFLLPSPIGTTSSLSF